MERTRYLIVGAGVSGLAFADWLHDEDYLLVEAEDGIGGYCRTVERDGFVWDYSGHFFHFRDPAIERYLVDRMEAQRVLRVERDSRIWYADRFIDALEGGYDFRVTHGGGNLSAGQAQLLAFARAVAANSDVIVLDEATSSVDSLTESLIERALARLYADKTVVAIAHRLSTIRNADQILVLDAGEVIESGTHQELLSREGAYARLVRGDS